MSEHPNAPPAPAAPPPEKPRRPQFGLAGLLVIMLVCCVAAAVGGYLAHTLSARAKNPQGGEHAFGLVLAVTAAPMLLMAVLSLLYSAWRWWREHDD